MTTNGVDDVLRGIAAALCELVGATRCSVFLKDEDGHVFRGRVGQASADIDEGVRRLVAGVEADAFTREILRTGRPVLVDDARVDSRPVRSAMRSWDVRAMLGVPLTDGGAVLGLAFLDHERETSPFTEADVRAVGALGPFAGRAIAQAQDRAAARAELRAAARQNVVLRRAAALDEHLHRAAIDGHGLRGIAEAVAESCGGVAAILDEAGRPLTVAPAGTAAEELRADLGRVPLGEPPAAEDAGQPWIAGPFPARGVHRTFLVAAVRTCGETLGRLVVGPGDAPFGALHRHCARRAAGLAALELSAQRRVVAAARDSLEALLSDLIRGDRDVGWLTRRGAELGVNLTAPQLLCLIAGGTPPLPAQALADGVAVQLGLRTLPAAALGAAVALLIPVPSADRRHVERVRNAVAEALADRRGLAAAISEPLRGPEEVADAQDETGQVLRCLQTLSPGGAVRALCAHELGAARVFLGSVDRAEADRFARRALGALRGPGSAPELLDTVQEFFARGRGIRQTASALGVHENTIRYRFTRVRELTGLDVYGDADDQTTALLALRVLQLQGLRPWHTPAAAERVLAAVQTS